jgi:hypothetical protein
MHLEQEAVFGCGFGSSYGETQNLVTLDHVLHVQTATGGALPTSGGGRSCVPVTAKSFPGRYRDLGSSRYAVGGVPTVAGGGHSMPYCRSAALHWV